VLVEMYQALQVATHGKWDVKEVASDDLAWWVTRRQKDTENPESVSRPMLHQWQLMYGERDDGNFRRGAYLRALAGRYGDLCRTQWDGYRKIDWRATELLLAKPMSFLPWVLCECQK